MIRLNAADEARAFQKRGGKNISQSSITSRESHGQALANIKLSNSSSSSSNPTKSGSVVIANGVGTSFGSGHESRVSSGDYLDQTMSIEFPNRSGSKDSDGGNSPLDDVENGGFDKSKNGSKDTNGSNGNKSKQPKSALSSSNSVVTFFYHLKNRVLGIYERSCNQVYDGLEFFWDGTNENLMLLFHTLIWKISVYFDVVFIFIAMNCGSYLWYAGLFSFLFITIGLQCTLHPLCARTDCDKQLPKNLGFLCYDFLLINKAAKLRLPFDYDTLAAITSGSGDSTGESVGPAGLVNARNGTFTPQGVISPSTVSTVIIFEKTFLVDLLQLMIQGMFLSDTSSPNNYMVYLSVFLGGINLVLNLSLLLYLAMKNRRSAAYAKEQQKIRLHELTTFIEEGGEIAGRAGETSPNTEEAASSSKAVSFDGNGNGTLKRENGVGG